MKSWQRNINGIFWACALAALFLGCKTTEEKKAAKEETILKLHLEKTKDNSADQVEVPVYRQRPVTLNIDTKEFLNNMDVVEASVVDVQGGFGIRLVFDDHGKRVLENLTARNIGFHIVVNAAWPPENRWLAAPRITRRLSDGTLVFTPDATREETERIVRGVNNLSKRIRE